MSVTIGTFAADCCARAESGHAATPPSSLMNARRFIGLPQGQRSPINYSRLARASQQGQTAHVRFGPKADICSALNLMGDEAPVKALAISSVSDSTPRRDLFLTPHVSRRDLFLVPHVSRRDLYRTPHVY